MHLSSTSEDGLADLFNYLRQLLRTNMGMGLVKDILRSSMLTQQGEYLA